VCVYTECGPKDFGMIFLKNRRHEEDTYIFIQYKLHWNIQGVSGGKVNILGVHSNGHSKQKLYMNMCPVPNGFRDRAI
jgi:hypothetical protein